MKEELARSDNDRAFLIIYNLNMTTIIGVKLSNRLDSAIEFQKIVSKFGCAIQSRIGLHKTEKRFCSSWGIILLEVIDNKVTSELEKELLHIEKIEIQRMVFN